MPYPEFSLNLPAPEAFDERPHLVYFYRAFLFVVLYDQSPDRTHGRINASRAQANLGVSPFGSLKSVAPRGLTSSALPPYMENGRSQPRDYRSVLREALPGSATPGTMVQTVEHTECSNRHVMAQSHNPKPAARDRHKRARTTSDNRRPCTPAPSFTACEAASPRSVTTVSPLSPVSQAPRHRAYSTTSQAPIQRPAGSKFGKPPHKTDISPPVPSPVSGAFGENASYQPRRPAPTTPPLRTTAHATSPIDAEVSFMEWDDEESALSKMKQRLKQGQNKIAGRAASRPEPKTKSPDKQENATPRALSIRSKPHSPPPQPLDTRQPLTSSNFSRPKKGPTHTYTSSNASRSAPGEHIFYQGPDLTGKATRPHANNPHGQPNNPSAKQHDLSLDHINTPREPRASLPQQVHRYRHHPQHQHQHQHTRSHPTVPNTISPQQSPRKVHSHHARHVASDHDAQDTDAHSGPFLANEAVPIGPPTPTSTRADTTTSMGRPGRLKALMKGLVKRALGGV